MNEWHATDVDLIQAIDRELAPRRRERVDRHLSACVLCAARLGRLQSTLDDVSRAIVSDPPGATDVSPYERTRLVAVLRAAADTPGGLASYFLGSLPWRTALAAVLVGILFLLPSLRTQRAGQDPWRPDASLTPGAVATLSSAQLCAGERPSRIVTAASQAAVLRSYGMIGVSGELFELDALVTPELGGTTEVANLWPQRYDSPVWNATVKDQLENLLPQLVCNGQVTLHDAQQALAVDWIAAYRTFFDTDVPLRNLATLADDDELEFETQTVAAGRNTLTFAAFVPREMY